jgi:hypothetical protein
LPWVLLITSVDLIAMLRAVNGDEVVGKLTVGGKRQPVTAPEVL